MQKNDISPITALLLLGLVVAAFLGLKSYEAIISNWPIIKSSVESNQDFLLFLISSFIVNIFVLNLITGRALGFKKQGSRLRSIKNNKGPKNIVLLKIVVSPLISYCFMNSVHEYGLLNSHSLKMLLPLSKYTIMIDLFSYSLLTSLAIIIYAILSVLMFTTKVLKLNNKLPLKTSVTNHLTLGSVGEEDSSIDNIEKPIWATIPMKALNGNILVTGSIGTGKTQGTILSYVKQLFTQFTETPTVLVLDPKGSIISEVITILRKRNLMNQVVYLGDLNANI
jgi:hypothetical protein